MSRSLVRRAARWAAVPLAAGLLCGSLGCSSSSGGNNGPLPDLGYNEAGIPIDRGVTADQGTPPPPDGGVVPDQAAPPVQLPPAPTLAGVVYLGHFLDPKLMVYRTDGAAPTLEKEIDLGANKLVHDMAVDRYNDLLFIATDQTKEVDVYQLSRPAGPGQPVADPAKVATIKIPGDHTPRFVKINPLRKRLYVFASPPLPASGPVTEHFLYAYDVSVPAQPALVAGAPYKIPTTTAMAVDPAREVLFVSDGRDDTLHGYDLGGDGFAPLAGSPIDIRSFYPQEQPQIAFQLRNLKIDPYLNRLYAARAQGALSELIAIEYPAALPAAGGKYGDLMTMGDLKPLAGPFDVNVPHDQRPNLIGTYEPAIDLQRGDVFMSALAWNGTSGTGIMVSVTRDLKLAKGCEAFEGFGCWYRSYFESKPGGYLPTDGTACIDYTHRIAVGTVVDDDNPGSVVFFKIKADDLTMEPWLSAEGKNLKAAAFPIAAVCH